MGDFTKKKRLFAGITIAKTTYGSKDIPISAKISSTKTVDLTAWIVPGGSLTYSGGHDNYTLVEKASLDGSIFSFTVRNSESVVGKIAIIGYQVSSDNYADYVITIEMTATAKDKQTDFKFENGSVTKTYGDEDFTLSATGEVKGSTVSGLVGEEKLTTQPTVKYVGADGSEIAPDMTKTGEVKILADGAGQGARHHRRHRRWAVRLRQRLHERADRGVPVAAVCGKVRSRPLIRIFPGRKAGEDKRNGTLGNVPLLLYWDSARQSGARIKRGAGGLCDPPQRVQ